jgi:hypothetical protein
MKVKLGNYKHYVGPYHIAEYVFFWVKKDRELVGDDSEEYEKRWDYRAREWFGEFLAYGFQKKDGRNKYFQDNREETWLYKLCSWIYSKRKRVEKVHIDRWDTWNVDYTLALIIAPLLKQLKQSKHGAPFVDDEDVPEELRSTSAPPKEHDYDTDDNHFKRWDYVLDEMIWAFEQQIKDDDSEDFWIEQPEGMYSEPCEDDPKLSTLKWDKEGKFDSEAYQAYHKRVANGCRLFGKYYQGLWS